MKSLATVTETSPVGVSALFRIVSLPVAALPAETPTLASEPTRTSLPLTDEELIALDEIVAAAFVMVTVDPPVTKVPFAVTSAEVPKAFLLPVVELEAT